MPPAAAPFSHGIGWLSTESEGHFTMTASFVSSKYANAPGSPIRELKRFSDRPGMISFAGGYPDPKLMDAEGLQASLAQL